MSAGYVLKPVYTRRAITAATTALTIDGTRKVCHFRSVEVVSMWMRYTSSGESGSTKGWRIFGTLVKGGMGPEDDELGVDEPDEAGVDAGVLRREDFVMVDVVVLYCSCDVVVLSARAVLRPGSLITARPELVISANERVTCHKSLASRQTMLA